MNPLQIISTTITSFPCSSHSPPKKYTVFVYESNKESAGIYLRVELHGRLRCVSGGSDEHRQNAGVKSDATENKAIAMSVGVAAFIRHNTTGRCCVCIRRDTRLKQIFPELPLLFYRQPPNLRKMLVRSALPKTTKAGTFPCNRCETCKYILCKDQVAISIHNKSPTFWTTIRGIYIGETGQKLRTRMKHHRHTINTKSWNFKTERGNTLRQGLHLGSGFMSHYVT
ncbi:hypothetical protein XELAEV_18022933mg [Xenopus laevis]|uniref:Uncharacterized protein n=1 Tax=Xenopus laevis TaxID=8355 RepID=A0A974D5W0_XENLA|nr:hypothetical protein XELAEV_18022933mg [Xenopus laevis]